MNIRKKKALRLKAAAARKQAEAPVVEEKAPVVEKPIKPKPKAANSSNSLASLSKPAAKPTGLSNVKPNNSLLSFSSFTL